MFFTIHCDEAIPYKDDTFILGFHSFQEEIASSRFLAGFALTFKGLRKLSYLKKQRNFEHTKITSPKKRASRREADDYSNGGFWGAVPSGRNCLRLKTKVRSKRK